jgi:hypothetical protein
MRSAALPKPRLVLCAAVVTFGCGGRSLLDFEAASVPVDAAADATPHPILDSGAPPADSGHTLPDGGDSSVTACRGQPWVIFSLSTSGPDQGPLSHRLYARHPDGSGGHFLHFPHEYVVYPSVSPDGASIVYADSSLDALYLYRFGATSDVTLGTMGVTGFGSLSPDGVTVVYGDGIDLWRVPAKGGGAATLFVPGNELPGGAAGYPVFTQDSQTVVFGALGAVVSVDVASGAMQTLVASASSEGFGNPALSPDYQSLAAIVSCDGSDYALRIYPYASLPAVCESGVLVTSVTLGAIGNDPAWGPTGLIAYSDDLNVILVNAAGTTTNLTADLTGMTDLATEPTWASACTKL